MPDKYSAIWLSHSSISTFRKCPRAYYLTSIYRDPRNGHKLALATPSFALGCAVHEVLESLSTLPTAERFRTPLMERFDKAWDKVCGQKGGFDNEETEKRFYDKGKDIITRVASHPGPLANKAVKIKMDLPHYWLSEADNLILCGKLDWLEYLPAQAGLPAQVGLPAQAGLESQDAVHIIDFKTGVGDESPDSLQLPIYYLLAHNCQSRPVAKASYWYVARDDMPLERKLPDLEQSESTLLKIGKEIKLARQLERFKCHNGDSGCKTCEPYEKILRGEATYVGTGDYGADTYALFDSQDSQASEIL